MATPWGRGRTNCGAETGQPFLAKAQARGVGATAVRARALSTDVQSCPAVGRVDQVPPPNFSLARFSCNFHVDTRTVIYVDYGIAVSTCIWRRERDSNPRRAFDPYTLSRGAPSTTRPSLRLGGKAYTSQILTSRANHLRPRNGPP